MVQSEVAVLSAGGQLLMSGKIRCIGTREQLEGIISGETQMEEKRKRAPKRSE